MTRMQARGILIVGGGPAGLAMAGALKMLGVEAVILDRGDRVGSSWFARYDRLRLHTVRAFSGLPGYPLPWRYPRYVTKDQYGEYLRDYAAYFGLNVELGVTVRKVRPAGDGGWRVETDRGERQARAVVVATGQFGSPVVPEWAGRAEFGGRVVHSSEYRSGREYAGERVLVVGAGNSGAEIAADLAEQGAAAVTLSIRTMPPIVPRQFLGTPVQVFGIALSGLSPRVADRIGAFVARVAMGDLSRYGVSKPAWMPFESKRVPIIDVGLVRQLKSGAVRVRAAVVRFTREGVAFADGTMEAFDVVVLATGFRSALEELVEAPGVIGVDGMPVGTMPGLYFIGFIESHRGHLFEANRAARRLAPVVRDYVAGLA